MLAAALLCDGIDVAPHRAASATPTTTDLDALGVSAEAGEIAARRSFIFEVLLAL